VLVFNFVFSSFIIFLVNLIYSTISYSKWFAK